MPSALAHRWSLVALVVALALVGCGGAGRGEDLGQAASPVTFPNDKAAFDYFVGKGLTSFQAAGIVGNLDQESGVDPASVQSGGPGRGIAQWSAGGRWDTDPNDNAISYAGQQGLPVLSLQLQLDFIWYELTTFSSYGLAALRQSTNVTDATIAFETDFEGCGQCAQATRIAYAEGVLAAYGSSPAYAAQFVSQSFPLAATTMTMVAGQVVPSYIELRNTGTKPWSSSTRLGTTQPRDRTSAFADGTWVAANRPAAVKGTVAPGGTFKFTFDLVAPTKPGTYDEFFGVVQEGVAWFSDSGQGGPADDHLEVKIVVTAAPGAQGDAGAPERDAGTSERDAGGDGSPSAGTSVVTIAGDDAGGEAFAGGASAGCSVGSARGEGAPLGGGLVVMLAVVGVAAGRRETRSLRRRRLARVSEQDRPAPV